MKRNAKPSARASKNVFASGGGWPWSFTAAISAPADAEAAKSIPAKSKPLPRKTVAKKRSSRSPR